MKGLILKDIYCISYQVVLVIILGIIMVISDTYYTKAIAMSMAAILPYTALAYDEQTKWDRYAEMMPYRKSSIVLSKYILILATVAFLMILGAIVAAAAFDGEAAQTRILSLLFCGCCTIMISSIAIPFTFKLGTGKALWIYVPIIIVMAGGGSALMNHSYGYIMAHRGMLMTVMVAVTAVALAVSIKAAIRYYDPARG